MSSGLAYRERLYAAYHTHGGDAAPTLDARYYDRWARVAWGHLAPLLPADRHARVLELGCGHGTLLHTLATRGFDRIKGVDRSPEQVAFARAVHDDVEEGDALTILAAADSGSYDVIIAIDLIEHLTKDEGLLLLDAIRRALAPGGRVILQTPNADSPRGPQVVAGDVSHEVSYTPRSLAQLLSLAGFEAPAFHPAGPVPHGLKSTMRWFLWRAVVLGTRLYDLVETGHAGSRVLTRVMIATGRKPR